MAGPPPIEFLEPAEPDGPGTRPQERLRRPGHGLTTRWWAVAGVALAVVAGVVVVSHERQPGAPLAAPSTAPSQLRPTAPPSPQMPTRPVPPDPVGRVAARPIAAATAAICELEPQCAVAGDAELAGAARRALRGTIDLQVRRIAPARAVIVSSLSASGARLLVLVTASSVRLDATTLGVRPPFGVQSQRNGRDNVLVIASGTTAAVALLSSGAVQRWIGGLRSTG